MTDTVLAGLLLLLAAVTFPRIFGIHVYTVISPSMAPEISVGSAVYVKKEAFEKICEGDVVTYLSGAGNVRVTHRVARKDEEGQFLVTKGDANDEPDGKRVYAQEILGVVRLAVPYLGYAAMFLNGIGEKMVFAGTFLWLLLIRTILANTLKIREKGVTIL